MAAPNVADGRAVLTVCVQLSAVIGSIVCAVLRGKKPQEPVDGATRREPATPAMPTLTDCGHFDLELRVASDPSRTELNYGAGNVQGAQVCQIGGIEQQVGRFATTAGVGSAPSD